MRVFAACAASFYESVRRAAGVEPLLSPPLTVDTFDVAAWGGHGFYYFKLHGLAGQPWWYGDGWTTAVSAEQVAGVDMSGAVVFVASCYLYDAKTGTGPMLEALLRAGARAVVGGTGENYAASESVAGADLLGAYFLQMTKLWMPPGGALKLAKARMKSVFRIGRSKRDIMAVDDALAFKLFE